MGVSMVLVDEKSEHLLRRLELLKEWALYECSHNRERKYHLQTTAYKLNALSQEWRQLCVKNMKIQSACTVLETQIDLLKREAAERGWNIERKTRECLTTSIAVRQPPSNPSTMSPLKF
ncbi:unnamed protein product [Brassica rapa]|uniref:Pre-mRNA-splicing factor SPF27 n=2 Tax=Brassica TaxID=3705 RepID=A0A8D9I1K4_BRACM|nr:unnamed protein product [Brassica napus]CAG7909903.1 unnamed protein product [Brassica rapa]